MRYVPNPGSVGAPPGLTNPGGTQGSSQGFSQFGAQPPAGMQQQQGAYMNPGMAQQGPYGAPQPQPQQAQQTNQLPSTVPLSPEGFPNGRPSEGEKAQLLPDVFKQPFMQGLQAAGTTGSYASQALPGAGNFQAGLYSPTLNPMEQQFMQSGAYLGSLGLEQAFNEIGQEYALDPYNMGKNKAYYDAANQFAAQQMNTGAQLGLDRMSLATQNLPNVFDFPNKAAGYGQESAAGYYNALEQARLGDLKLPLDYWKSYPIQGSDYIQPAPQSGGK